jgi:hypothetical protein
MEKTVNSWGKAMVVATDEITKTDLVCMLEYQK